MLFWHTVFIFLFPHPVYSCNQYSFRILLGPVLRSGVTYIAIVSHPLVYVACSISGRAVTYEVPDTLSIICAVFFFACVGCEEFLGESLPTSRCDLVEFSAVLMPVLMVVCRSCCMATTCLLVESSE